MTAGTGGRDSNLNPLNVTPAGPQQELKPR